MTIRDQQKVQKTTDKCQAQFYVIVSIENQINFLLKTFCYPTTIFRNHSIAYQQKFQAERFSFFVGTFVSVQIYTIFKLSDFT
jgi:hypothetical protein